MKQTQPSHLLAVAVKPISKADKQKMLDCLEQLASEDPSLQIKDDLESGEVIIKGKCELHLDKTTERLKHDYGIEAIFGAPQVAYRETITREAEIDYAHKKQFGGSGQFARVKIVFEPNPDGEDFTFESKVVGGNVPKEYIPGVEVGVQSVIDAGPVAGFPMLGVKATLLDGAYHDVDSSVLAFEIASRAAFREGAQKAGAQLLEPIMKVEVVTPEDYMGDVIGDLNLRRGQISGTEIRSIDAVVSAMVPLANMFGYVNSLRSISQGRAQYTMEFDHYAPTPSNDDPGNDFPPAVGIRA